MSKAFESIKAGLLDALAHARGEPNGCVVHRPVAELEQHSPPKGKDVGSSPTGTTKNNP